MKFKSDAQRRAMWARLNMMSNSPLDIAMRKYDKDKIVKLGAGSDRRVYALDDDNVLKVIKNRRGLEQNYFEGDAGTHMTPDVSYKGEDYVVVERADINVPRTRKILESLKNIPYHSDKWERRDALMRAASKIDAEHGTDLQNIIGSYNPTIEDMLREKNWGWNNDEMKLIDAGVLSDNYLKTKKISDYRYVPNYDYYYHDLSDWRNILRDRSIARKEGRLDLSRKPKSEFSSDMMGVDWEEESAPRFSSLGGMFDVAYDYGDGYDEFSKKRTQVGLLPGNKVQTTVSEFTDKDEYDVDAVPQEILDRTGLTRDELLTLYKRGQLAIAPKGSNIKFV